MLNEQCCDDLSCPSCNAPASLRLTPRAVELLQVMASNLLQCEPCDAYPGLCRCCTCPCPEHIAHAFGVSQPAPLGQLVRVQLATFATSQPICFAMTLQRCRGYDRAPFADRCTTHADRAAWLAIDANTIEATRAPDDWHRRVLARSLRRASYVVELQCARVSL